MCRCLWSNSLLGISPRDSLLLKGRHHCVFTHKANACTAVRGDSDIFAYSLVEETIDM
jgi:hypothetical protein